MQAASRASGGVCKGDRDMGWVVRALLIAGDVIAGWFVARDAVNFPVIAAVAGFFLFVCLVALVAYWQPIARIFQERTGSDKPK